MQRSSRIPFHFPFVNVHAILMICQRQVDADYSRKKRNVLLKFTIK